MGLFSFLHPKKIFDTKKKIEGFREKQKEDLDMIYEMQYGKKPEDDYPNLRKKKGTR